MRELFQCRRATLALPQADPLPSGLLAQANEVIE
jgi:hypothetical protein